jgi:type II secretory pathway component GspD/PulD (secretin)
VRTNALVVSAPVENLPLLEQLIYKLDMSAPELAKIKVFSLLNADAGQMAGILSDLFRLSQVDHEALPAGSAGAGGPRGQRSVRYSLIKPPLVGPPAPGSEEGAAAEVPGTATVGSIEQAALTVTVDYRTNSLLVGGTDHYVALAADIIEQLDASPARERDTKVYRLRNAQAQDLQAALTNFLEQSRQRVAQALGTEALGSTQRQLEEEVAIVAEPTTNSLLLAASPRYFAQVEDLIMELDLPQPQVLIHVLLAEVSLDKTT